MELPVKINACLRGYFLFLTIHRRQTPSYIALTYLQRRNNSSVENGFSTIDDVAKHILKATTKHIVVMAGAGISTPCGIPDFRSPGSGLYHNLQKYNLPYPEAIFDLDYFCMNNRPFFTLAKELYPGKFKPSIAHYFVRLLHEKKLLLRMYTQNIDGMERLAGVPEEQLVEAHGSFSTATCMKCGKHYSGDDIKDAVFRDKIPICTKEMCKGVIKPDIVFFGEQLPMKFWLHSNDMPMADLLIVMGTSLVVQPFAGIAEEVPHQTPRLLINNEEVGYIGYRTDDVVYKGDVVEGVELLLKKLNWMEDLKQIMFLSYK